MRLPFRFRPRIVPTVVALAAAVATAWLGDWQLDRAAYKAELQQRLELAARQPALRIASDPVRTADVAFYRVEALGEFVQDATILLDNRVHHGVVGYEVITPLKLAGGTRHLLVNRGWVQAPPTRAQLPAIHTPGGPVTLGGIALPPPGPVFQLASVPDTGPVWQHLALDRVRERFGFELQPLVLRQDSDTPDGLLRDWPRPDTGISTHRAYAVQWFAMSLVILLLYVVLNVRKQSEPLGPA